MAQIGADKGKISFVAVNILNAANAFNCPLLVNVTAHPINGISRVDDHPAIAESFYYPVYLSRLGIIRIDPYQHLFELGNSSMQSFNRILPLQMATYFLFPFA